MRRRLVIDARSTSIPRRPLALDAIAMLNAYARNRFANAVLLQDRAVALDNGQSAACRRSRTVVARPGRRSACNRFGRLSGTNVAGRCDGKRLCRSDCWCSRAQCHRGSARKQGSGGLSAAAPAGGCCTEECRPSQRRRPGRSSAICRWRTRNSWPRVPRVDLTNLQHAVDLALVFQRMGDVSKATPAARRQRAGHSLDSATRLVRLRNL